MFLIKFNKQLILKIENKFIEGIYLKQKKNHKIPKNFNTDIEGFGIRSVRKNI